MDWQRLAAEQPALALIPAQLRVRAEAKGLSAGETLFRIGDRVHAVFAVLAGEVHLVRRDRKGTEMILQRSRGGFFAEASLNSERYHCDCLAADETKLLRFPAPDFRAALNEDSGFRDAWMAHLAGEVRRLRARCERLSLHSAADRIVHFIESEGRAGSVVLNQSRKAWAAELGLTHEALYRALRRLQDEGVLQVDADRIELRQGG